MSGNLFYHFFKETSYKIFNNSDISEENRLFISNLIQAEDEFILKSSDDFANKLENRGRPKNNATENNGETLIGEDGDNYLSVPNSKDNKNKKGQVICNWKKVDNNGNFITAPKSKNRKHLQPERDPEESDVHIVGKENTFWYAKPRKIKQKDKDEFTIYLWAEETEKKNNKKTTSSTPTYPATELPFGTLSKGSGPNKKGVPTFYVVQKTKVYEVNGEIFYNGKWSSIKEELFNYPVNKLFTRGAFSYKVVMRKNKYTINGKDDWIEEKSWEIQ